MAVTAETAKRTALIECDRSGQTWTFGQLDRDADNRARALMRGGYARGTRIAILARNSAAFLTTYFGIMRAGLVAVPVNYRLPAETIGFILADAGVDLIYLDAEFAPALRTSAEQRLFEEDAIRTVGSFDSQPCMVRPEPGEVAEILYTSGSTGRPKGVALTHEGQLWALAASSRPSIGERTLIAAPMYHMNALFFMGVALLSGMRIALMPSFDARDYLKATAEHRCTLLSGIPTMFAMLARERDLIERLDLSTVRRILIGSAPLTEALIERVKRIFPEAELNNRFGTTEGGPAVFGEHPQGILAPPLSVGYPLPGVQCRLVDGPSDSEGVLEIKTPAVLKEYINLPELTAERIRDGWYRTGDVMRRDSLGFFYFVGRADDMFVCGGENVYPGEIEQLLESHPGVVQAAVVPVPDEMKGEIPIAFVVPAPGETLIPGEIRAFALQRGPAFSHPRAVIIVDEMPLAGTNKIDKRALMPRALAAAAALRRTPSVKA